MSARLARSVGRGVAVGALAWALPAGASPDIAFGFGSRAQALGGASVAIADDGAAVFHNPSGLVRAERPLVSIGISSTSYSLETSGTPASLPAVNTIDAGLVVPGAIFTVPVAFGFALALPDGRLSRLREPQPTEAYWALDDADARLVDVGSTFAVRPLPWLLLGGGIGFQASLRGTFRVEGTAVVADGTGSEYESELTHAVDADLTASRFPLLGATFLPSDAVAVGLSYRGASLVQHQIQGALDGTLVLPDASVPVRYDFHTKADVAYTPAQIAFGASFRPIPSVLATAELDWQRYSAYRSPYPETSTHTALPPELGIVVPDTAPIPAPAANFDDRFVPHLAVEPSIALAPRFAVKLRAGYSFQAAPVPRTQPATRLLAVDRHVVALGAGGSWQRPIAPFEEIHVDLAFADALGVPQTLTTTAGQNADHLSGHVLLVGASLGIAFEGE